MKTIQWRIGSSFPISPSLVSKINIITIGALLLWTVTTLVAITAATAIPSTEIPGFGDGGDAINYPMEVMILVNNQTLPLLMRGDHATWRFDGDPRETNFIHNIGVEEGPFGLACFLWAHQRDLYEGNARIAPFIYGPAYAGSPATIINKDFGNYRFLTCLRLPYEREDLITIWFEVPETVNSSGIIPPPPSPPPIGRAMDYMDSPLLSEPPADWLNSKEHSYNLAFVTLWDPPNIPISERYNPQRFIHGVEYFEQLYSVSRAAIVSAPSDDVICRLFYDDERGKVKLNSTLLLPRKQMTKQVDQAQGFYCRAPHPSLAL